jgi:hypothetical protein
MVWHTVQDRFWRAFRGTCCECVLCRRCCSKDGHLVVGERDPLPAIVREELRPVFGLFRLVCHGSISITQIQPEPVEQAADDELRFAEITGIDYITAIR